MRFIDWFRTPKHPKTPRHTDAAHWAACHFPGGDSDVARRVAEILVEQLGVGLDGVAPLSHLVEDLAMTELEPTQVVMALEEEFGFAIPDADCERLSTVADLVQYLQGRIQANAS
jgi:acyl carrier protein